MIEDFAAEKYVHRAEVEADDCNQHWTVYARDVLGSERGVPLGYITINYFLEQKTFRCYRDGFKAQALNGEWEGVFPSFEDAISHVLVNHPFKHIEAVYEE